MYVCFFISDFWWNRFPQNSQGYGLVSEWMRRCVDNVDERLNTFLHCLHYNEKKKKKSLNNSSKKIYYQYKGGKERLTWNVFSFCREFLNGNCCSMLSSRSQMIAGDHISLDFFCLIDKFNGSSSSAYRKKYYQYYKYFPVARYYTLLQFHQHRRYTRQVGTTNKSCIV